MFVEFAHSGKFVPILTKAYANVLGAQAHVWTTQKLFQGSTDPEKESCVMSKKFYHFKTKHMSLPMKRGKYGGKRHENTRKRPKFRQ